MLVCLSEVLCRPLTVVWCLDGGPRRLVVLDVRAIRSLAQVRTLNH